MTTELETPVALNQLTAEPLEGLATDQRTSTRLRKPRAPYVPVAYTCGGCTQTWSGINRAHCSGCHRTWSGPSMFDQHRRLIKGEGICVDPATLPSQVFRDGVWRSAAERPTGSWGEDAK